MTDGILRNLILHTELNYKHSTICRKFVVVLISKIDQTFVVEDIQMFSVELILNNLDCWMFLALSFVQPKGRNLKESSPGLVCLRPSSTGG